MKNNKGFSLIELIIVVAIIGLLTAGATVGFGLLTHQAAKVASRDVYNMIGSAQTVAMSKGNSYYVISCDSNGNKKVFVAYKVNGSSDWKVLQESSINKNVTLAFVCDGTTYDIDGSSGSNMGVVLQINRATGKFEKSYYYSGNETAPLGGETVGVCSDITVTQGDRVYDIGLVAATGKYYFK